MRLKRIALALTLVALLAAGLAAVATASAPPKPVTSKPVPVTGAVVTKVTVRAAVKNDKLTVTLVPGKLPFAQKIVSLKGKVSDWSASAIKVSKFVFIAFSWTVAIRGRCKAFARAASAACLRSTGRRAALSAMTASST